MCKLSKARNLPAIRSVIIGGIGIWRRCARFESNLDDKESTEDVLLLMIFNLVILSNVCF